MGKDAHLFIMNILTWPHPALKQKCQNLKRVTDEVREVANEMIRLQKEARGVGLAANQVGYLWRMFVIGDSAFVNPVVSNKIGNEIGEEGCLSYPGTYLKVRRAKSLHLSAYSLTGEEIEEDLTDFAARIVQHEMDHLDGIMFFERVK